jgi:GT2 family glycosyltransferase
VSRSVVVLSYQPGEWLRDCLESAIAQADEVILIDNGSTGASASTIGRAAGALVVRMPDNLGFAGGVNLGVRRARGDVIALLNDDATAGPGWLDSAERILADRQVGAVTPRIRRTGWYRQVVLPDSATLRSVTVDDTQMLSHLLGDGIGPLEHDGGADRFRRAAIAGRPFYVPVDDDRDIRIDGDPAPPGPRCRLLNKAGGYLLPDGVLGDHGDETPDDSRWDQPAERFFASGTALVARAETWRRVGGLAEPFFAYYEDGDWCWRVRLAGLRILYDPTAIVEHRHSATSGGSVNPLVRRLAERNRLLCLIRNAPTPVVGAALRRAARTVPLEQGRRQLLSRVPWALASRLRLARGWQLSADEVWRRWAGADSSWDRGPLQTVA